MLYVKLWCDQCQQYTYHHLKSTGVHEDGQEKIAISVLCIGHNEKHRIGHYEHYKELTVSIIDFRKWEFKQVADIWK